MAMEKIYLSWLDIDQLVAKIIPPLRSQQFDALIAITRGGIVPGGILAAKLNITQVLIAAVEFYKEVEEGLALPIFVQFPEDAFLSGKRLLVVDDVWYTGLTVVNVRERIEQAGGTCVTVVLHYKPGSSKVPDARPDILGAQTDDWVIYPWEQTRDRARQ
jgi:uncharacterized protein